jgi:hypothetical protein
MVRDRDAEEASGRSAIIYGRGEQPMAVLAAALARRAHPDFSWVSCSESSGAVDEAIREVLARHAPRGQVRRLAPTDLEAPQISETTFDALTTSSTERDLLLELLRLPGILQDIVQYPPDLAVGSGVVLAWVDGLPSRVVTDTFFDAGLYATLRHARVSMVATFRGVPPLRLRRHFDRVFRVRSLPGTSWSEAQLRLETTGTISDGGYEPLRSMWPRLDLDPSFLTS